MTAQDASLTLVVRRRIAASPSRLYAAWTTPSELARWWGPRGVRCTGAEIDLRVGGRYRIGNLLPDGTEIAITGEFEVVDPDRRLVFSWATRPDAPPERVTVRFEARGEETEVIVLHERIGSPAARASHEGGWEGCLAGLDADATA